MLVFVTGASGYIGLHIVDQLLQAGHTVKGTARGDKFTNLKAAYADTPAFEAVEIADIGSGSLAPLLQGVDAIIHTAAPLGGRVSFEESQRYATEGGVHIIREAYKAGVRRAVVTSSIATFPNDAWNGPYGHKDFPEVTVDEAKADMYKGYVYQKTSVDKSVIAFAEAHPEMKVVILAPVWTLGPQAPKYTQIIPKRNVLALATQVFLLTIITSDGSFYTWSPGAIDVRDVARVHIRALSVTPATDANWGRYLIASPEPYSWKGAIQLLKEKRPELLGRLADPAGAPDWPENENRVRLSKEEKEEQDWLFGVKREGVESTGDVWGYRSAEEMVLDGVDNLLEIERVWDQNASNEN
ncbi:NAD(P)-binding protein [Cylindrobasidium torrendii FP15055 ss-10]|uniref:NAD(P)-binding protein n=1 Tax=Cylindrobasidium torrendii FP15055 ss-10 TaxID=1314674 RepID=A0A0D7BHX6_9AGAR|nr:NAD(P)-binding protein [Cylindrobasidium torrendii FP15055 ss-10]